MAANVVKDALTRILIVFVAVIFIYAGAVKIINPAAFAESVDNYRMLPYFLVSIIAIILPWLELICGILLLTQRWRTASALILLGLNIIFVIAITSALIRGLDIGCGCFSVEGEGIRISVQKLVEDLALLAANAVIFLRSLKSK